MEEDQPRVLDPITGPSEPYVDYDCKTGLPHIGYLREASGLACVSYPKVTYKLKMDKKYYEPGGGAKCQLSGAQVEAVVLACESHTKFFRGSDIDHDPDQRIVDEDPDEEEELAVCESEPEETDGEEEEVEEDSMEAEDPPEGNGDFQSTEDRDAMDDVTIAALGPETHIEKVYRRGFFLGDGTGTGKSITLGGIVLENFCGGSRKCLFVTAGKGLFVDFKKTLKKLFDPNSKSKLHYTSARDSVLHEPEGEKMHVFRVTYGWLRDDHNLAFLDNWLGQDFRDLMIFDEVHNGKSAYKRGRQSATGKRLMYLQYKYPKSRVVYSSATAASEVHHLLVFPRLELWGKGTPFQSHLEFQRALIERGVAGLELLVMELKMAGKLVCRQLSFQNVDVHFQTIHLSEEFKITYKRACELWSVLLLYQEALKRAFTEVYEEDKEMIKMLPQRVACLFQLCQSFFGTLMVSSKLSFADHLARSKLAKDMSVILGIQRTGASKFEMYYKKQRYDVPYSNAMFILRIAMLKLGIPLGHPRAYLKNGRRIKIGDWKTCTHEQEDEIHENVQNMWDDIYLTDDELFPEDKIDWLLEDCSIVDETTVVFEKWLPYTVGTFIDDINQMSPHDLSWSIDEVRAKPTLKGFAKLYHELCPLLPVNPLDELKNRFENPPGTAGKCSILEEAASYSETVPPEFKRKRYQVAEMTGRLRTYDFDRRQHVWKIKGRDSNVNKERRMFQGHNDPDYKHVAIISSSASTGFNLHSAMDHKVKNKEPRVHITVEMGWAAEGLLQQLGRSHRSNQKHNPTYFILWSNVPGEKRFMSMLGKRLRNLGAASHGHPEGNPHTGFMCDDLCSIVGAMAINASLVTVENEHPALHRLVKTLDMNPIGWRFQSSEGIIAETTAKSITRFLNRIMVMPVCAQDKFLSIIEDNLEQLKTKYSIYKSLRLIPGKLGEVELVKKCELMKLDYDATIYMLKISRYACWNYMMKTMEEKPLLKFYYYREFYKKRILAIECNPLRQNLVIHPYNRNFERIEENRMQELELVQIDDMAVAKKLWDKQIEEILSESGKNSCGHYRAIRSCPFRDASPSCTYQWAIMDCVLLAGHASVFVPDLMKIPFGFLPVNLGKASFKDGECKKDVVGLYFCKENTTVTVSGIYNFVCNLYQKD